MEYVLLLALISVPMSIVVLRLLQLIIRVVVAAIVQDFTEGPV